MIDEFEGLDRVIPRQVRHDLITWRDQGLITIERLALADQPTLALDRRSPLRRAALAALTHLVQAGADLSDVKLAGYRLPTAARVVGRLNDPRWWITWKWQHYRAIPDYLPGKGALRWLEIPAPTRTRALTALAFTPGAAARTRRP